MLNFYRPLCILSLVGCLLSMGATAHAQTIPVKQGLWVTAAEVMINGKRMPTMLDLKNALNPTQKVATQTALTNMGLPPKWTPSTNCIKSGSIDTNKIMSRMTSMGCNAMITSKTASTINMDLVCNTKQGSGNGTASVTGINTDTVNYVANIDGTLGTENNSMPVQYQATAVSKYIGPDCSALPAGANTWPQNGDIQ